MNAIQYASDFIEKYIGPVSKLVSKVPQAISLEVTTRCQLDCIYCTRDKNHPRDFPLENLEMLRAQLKGVKKLVICGIGESFCYVDIYNMIWRQKDLKVSIITNGAVPIDFKKLNRERNVELLVFSIDATKEEKIKAICPGYNFNVLVENLSELKKYPNIAGIINTTITELNIDEIPLLVEFAAKHKLLAVNYELPIGNEEFVKANKESINKNIKEAIKVAKRNNIVFNQFYRLSCNSGGCIIPNIQLNGDFYPCCNGMHKGKKLGNIFEEDLEVLWNGRAEPLLSDSEFCLKCSLARNLFEVLN
ncbi:radical SAM protein [Ruminiclostridium papyrosolvens]|uniref:Radical SAM core domain-containing protein n=1 Tax=Ruminiclostridium papyrosolvens C7 TaxID=1330534 RepID=U4R067_9FIRM|nr:radical SAM protein [Ruminiclostridium papyrosolvens]EPR10516.1 hypothetical protein L323_13050 [Ruminiclostridium papyrosolvens C7]